MLNCCSEFPDVFVTDAGINDEDDVNISLIQLHHCKNIISCSFHKQIFTKHKKACPSCINIENVGKVEFTTWKSLVLKS